VKRSTMVMMLIFIVLGISVFLLEKPFSEPEKPKTPELGPMYPDFKADEITKVEFGSFGGATTIVKENDKWVVNDNGKNYPADADGISKALDTVATLNAKELISTNPAKHITFQVNGPQQTESTDAEGNKQPFKMGTLGTEVKMMDKDGNLKVHLFVGKNGASDFMSTYVRKDGSDSVVLVDGYLKAIFGKGSTANWKDRTICKIDKEKMSKIVVGEGRDQIVLEAVHENAAPEQPAADASAQASPKPVEVKWNMTAPKVAEIDKKQSDRLVSMFQNFLATDYAPDVTNPKDYGFDKPSAVASIYLTDGSEIKIKMGAESADKKGQYFIQRDGDERIFIVPKYRLETLQKNAEDYINPPKSDSPPVKPTASKPAVVKH
jgi:hypothetical protein